MRTLLLTILTIICLGVIFTFASNTNAQESDQEQGQIFPRKFDKNMMCSHSDFVYQDLKERLQVTKVWWGLSSNGNLSELFVNLNTGRWLFMLSFTDKITCGLVGGEMSVPYDKNPYFK